MFWINFNHIAISFCIDISYTTIRQRYQNIDYQLIKSKWWCCCCCYTASDGDNGLWLVDHNDAARSTSTDKDECTKTPSRWRSAALNCPTHQTGQFVEDFSSSLHWRGRPRHPPSLPSTADSLPDDLSSRRPRRRWKSAWLNFVSIQHQVLRLIEDVNSL